MNRLVLIIGGNGSGKSTVMKKILGDEPKIMSHPMGFYTLNEKDHRVIVGKYNTPCGGCDGIKSTFTVYNLVDWLCRNYMDYDIYFEGVIVSGIFDNVARFLVEAQYSLLRNVSLHYLWTSPALSIKRVLSRNGGKNISFENIKGKVISVMRCFMKHRELNLYPCIAYDTSHLSPDEIANKITAGN